MTDDVLIAGRSFALGAAYRPRRPWVYGWRSEAPRRLLGHDAAFPWRDGRVETAADGPRSDGRRRAMSGRAWAAWAGEVAS